MILLRARPLAGIRGVLIDGRLDMGSAWDCLGVGAWPDARLVVIDDSGHTGSETRKNEILATLRGFARR